jgi:hypothetical protein
MVVDSALVHSDYPPAAGRLRDARSTGFETEDDAQGFLGASQRGRRSLATAELVEKLR